MNCHFFIPCINLLLDSSEVVAEGDVEEVAA